MAKNSNFESNSSTLAELVESLDASEGFRKKVIEEFDSLPSVNFKEKYYSTFHQILNGKEEDPVRRNTGVRGALFEIDRINKINRQGLESLIVNNDTSSLQEIVVDEYRGFPNAPSSFTADENLPSRLPENVGEKLNRFYEHTTDANKWALKEGVGLNKVKSMFQDPNMVSFLQEMYEMGATEVKKKSPISLDVPIQRDKPYIYETKSFPRKIYGQFPSQINQLLKYQKAIDSELVTGATVEIDGRVDPAFLNWASGNYVNGFGEIPDVEILYSLPLPSGKEHRFILKSARKEGLRFQNENHLSDEDKKIIKGIQKSINDGSILNIISDLDAQDFEGIEPEHVKNPSLISDVNEFEKYENFRLESLWNKLRQKYNDSLINDNNNLNAYSLSANEENIEKMIRNYQAYLRQNPEIAKVKKSYLVEEEQIPSLVEKTMSLVECIREYETKRQISEIKHDIRERRTEKGYNGLPEGVALDVDHIIIDAIQEINKKDGKVKRSYNDISRFKTADELENYLETAKSKRYIEAKVYDPKTEKISTIKSSRGGDKAVLDLEKKILEDNIQRLEEEREKKNMGINKKIHLYQNGIQKLESEKNEKIEEAKKAKDYEALKTISGEYNSRIFEEKQNLENEYKSLIGENRYKQITSRITNIIDQDILKFIYVVNADESVIVDEEIVRGEVSGRASHSELAQGRNVYGAGELIYSKHNCNFNSFEEWSKFRKEIEEKPTWKLTEINNGSGHYRPSPETLTYVKNVLDQNYNIDVSNARLVNTLVRGAQIKDMDVF